MHEQYMNIMSTNSTPHVEEVTETEDEEEDHHSCSDSSTSSYNHSTSQHHHTKPLKTTAQKFSTPDRSNGGSTSVFSTTTSTVIVDHSHDYVNGTNDSYEDDWNAVNNAWSKMPVVVFEEESVHEEDVAAGTAGGNGADTTADSMQMNGFKNVSKEEDKENQQQNSPPPPPPPPQHYQIVVEDLTDDESSEEEQLGVVYDVNSSDSENSQNSSDDNDQDEEIDAQSLFHESDDDEKESASVIAAIRARILHKKQLQRAQDDSDDSDLYDDSSYSDYDYDDDDDSDDSDDSIQQECNIRETTHPPPPPTNTQKKKPPPSPTAKSVGNVMLHSTLSPHKNKPVLTYAEYESSMKQLNSKWEYALQQTLDQSDGIVNQQLADYEEEKKIAKIRHEEEMNQMKEIASVWEERLKEMEGRMEEEKQRAVEEALRKEKEERMEKQKEMEEVLLKEQREKQERFQRQQQQQEQEREMPYNLQRLDSWTNTTITSFKTAEDGYKTSEESLYDSMPPPPPFLPSFEGDNDDTNTNNDFFQKKVSATPEEEANDSETDEDIVQIMKDHNSWMFNVLEDERSVATSTDGCGSILPKKKSIPLTPITSNSTASEEHDDAVDKVVNSETSEYDPQYHPKKKLALKQVLHETTTKLQQLLYQLSTPNCLTCSSPQNQKRTKPKIQALLSTVSHAVLNAANMEREEALQKARVEHLKAMEVALNSTMKSAVEEKDALIQDLEAKHQVELAAVRWNSDMARESERERKERMKKDRKDKNDKNKKKSRKKKDEETPSRDTASLHNESISSFSLSSDDTNTSTSTQSQSQQAQSSIMSSPIFNKKENTLLSSERSLYWAEMEAALRGATVTALREKEDALRNARVEHANVLKTVMMRAAAAEQRSQQELSKVLAMTCTAVQSPGQQILASPPSTSRSIMDTNGATWVKKEDYEHKVRLALKQAVDISTKSNVKIQEQRKGILKTSRRFGGNGATNTTNQSNGANNYAAMSNRRMDSFGSSANIVGGGGDIGVHPKNSGDKRATFKMESKRKVSGGGGGGGKKRGGQSASTVMR